MTGKAIFLPEAKKDMTDLYLYVARHDSITHADGLFLKIKEACSSLANNPERGHVVPELKKVFVEGFREIHFKPYRIIFQTVCDDVYIHAVLDGRRELQELLEKRLLG
jgi:toxin ParE1/3/4